MLIDNSIPKNQLSQTENNTPPKKKYPTDNNQHPYPPKATITDQK